MIKGKPVIYIDVKTVLNDENNKFRDRLLCATDAANPDPKVPSLCDVVLPEQGEDFRIILFTLREGGYQSCNRSIVVFHDDLNDQPVY